MEMFCLKDSGTVGLLKMFHLTGKTAIVTGASRGIGEAIAKGFAQAGAELYLASNASI